MGATLVSLPSRKNGFWPGMPENSSVSHFGFNSSPSLVLTLHTHLGPCIVSALVRGQAGSACVSAKPIGGLHEPFALGGLEVEKRWFGFLLEGPKMASQPCFSFCLLSLLFV